MFLAKLSLMVRHTYILHVLLDHIGTAFSQMISAGHNSARSCMTLCCDFLIACHQQTLMDMALATLFVDNQD